MLVMRWYLSEIKLYYIKMILRLNLIRCTSLNVLSNRKTFCCPTIIFRIQSTVSVGDVEKAISEVVHPEYVPVNYCKYLSG